MVTIRSRIHQYIKPELMKDLKKISTDVRISDNNTKVKLIREALDMHKLHYHELGPGTNRFAILVDNYVFKIAMDKWGVLDNDNEFAMTETLQPFVTTVYETNGLISVSEYVTLLGRDEFTSRKPEIIKILSILAEGFLLGDVGYHPKNFTNWGYRTDGSLVILDFAYIYSIIGEEIMCVKDGNLLQYDENFTYMRCPHCRRKYETIDIRKQITSEHEKNEIRLAKEAAYAVKHAVTEFEDKEEDIEETNEDEIIVKEESIMERELTIEEERESIERIAQMFEGLDYDNIKVENKPLVIEEEEEVDDTYAKIVSEVEMSLWNKREEETEEEIFDRANTFEHINDIANMMSKLYREDYDESESVKQEGEVIEEEEEFEYDPRNPLEDLMMANDIDPDEIGQEEFKLKHDYENGEGPIEGEFDDVIEKGEVEVPTREGVNDQEVFGEQAIVEGDEVDNPDELEEAVREGFEATRNVEADEEEEIPDETEEACDTYIEPDEPESGELGTEPPNENENVEEVGSEVVEEVVQEEDDDDEVPDIEFSPEEMAAMTNFESEQVEGVMDLSGLNNGPQETSIEDVDHSMIECVEPDEAPVSEPSAVRRIGSYSADTENRKPDNVQVRNIKEEKVEESPAPQDDDIMGSILAAQQQRMDLDDEEEANEEIHEQDRYEELAEKHLGKDPYDY